MQNDEEISTEQRALLGHFAAAVAHDFNNVLGSMSVFCQLLQDAVAADNLEAREYLGHMQTSCRMGRNYTANLQMFSGGSMLSRESLRLEALVRDLEPLLGSIVNDDMVIALDCEAETPAIMADRAMMEQILINCTVNAREAMPEGGRLSLMTAQVSDPAPPPLGGGDIVPPGTYVCLTIEDSGAGIAPEHLAKVWDPYFTTKTSKHDIGLGLAVVSKIIKAHNGFFQVASQVGQGTVFTFFFPV